MWKKCGVLSYFEVFLVNNGTRPTSLVLLKEQVGLGGWKNEHVKCITFFNYTNINNHNIFSFGLFIHTTMTSLI